MLLVSHNTDCISLVYTHYNAEDANEKPTKTLFNDFILCKNSFLLIYSRKQLWFTIPAAEGSNKRTKKRWNNSVIHFISNYILLVTAEPTLSNVSNGYCTLMSNRSNIQFKSTVPTGLSCKHRQQSTSTKKHVVLSIFLSNYKLLS